MPLTAGDKAPEFTLKDDQGKNFVCLILPERLYFYISIPKMIRLAAPWRPVIFGMIIVNMKRLE